jgi:hypothetical protein
MRTTTLSRIAQLAPLPVIAIEPLAAIAYHRTQDGAGEPQAPWVRAWSEPVQNTVEGAFTWAPADTVYLTYGKVYLVAMIGILCAVVALHRNDSSDSRLSRWAPRVALTTFGLTTLGVAGEYWTPWTDQVFLFVSVPSLLLIVLSSPLLVAWLLRRQLGSLLGAWMVALTLPGIVGLTILGGHLGFAIIWLSMSWALHGHALLARSAGSSSGVAEPHVLDLETAST